MTDENKALIGRQCYVEFEGKRQIADILDIVETVKSTNEIILYCLRLKDGTRLGREKVDLKCLAENKTS